MRREPGRPSLLLLLTTTLALAAALLGASVGCGKYGPPVRPAPEAPPEVRP